MAICGPSAHFPKFVFTFRHAPFTNFGKATAPVGSAALGQTIQTRPLFAPFATASPFARPAGASPVLLDEQLIQRQPDDLASLIAAVAMGRLGEGVRQLPLLLLIAPLDGRLRDDVV